MVATIVVQVPHRVVAVQIAAVAVWAQLKMAAERVAKPPVMTGVMMAVKMRQGLLLVLIVALIAVMNVKTQRSLLTVLVLVAVQIVVLAHVLLPALMIVLRAVQQLVDNFVSQPVM
ncbi:hypothetical protein ABHZ61_19360, partial [Bacteroides thetaiotaomicron]